MANLPAKGQLSAEPPNPQYAQPRDRITRFIDDEQHITLRGNVHPMARAEFDLGPVSADYRMDRMLLTLLPDSSQQGALSQFLEAQHNPESSYYHQWLTPEQFGERFGVSESDTAQIVEWLEGHGMEVEEVAAGRRSIVFSGTAAQVQAAFHTQIHAYKMGDDVHHANAKEPEIPTALINVVGGVVSLHDFHSEPLHAFVRKASPEFSSGGSYYLGPADFATIYDLAPLYQQSINGGGQSIAIVGRSNIKIADVRQFRTLFGLPANDPQIVVNGNDPGVVSPGEETEADLDVEWSGAVARKAAIKFVVSKSTNSSDGVDLSAQYIVNHNLSPVMSTSFGLCEASLGSSGNSFLNSLWEQAAAQGITVLVSSGDSGAAGCDSASALTATNGKAVNGLCSTPYSVCVGGTEFNDRADPSLYWSPANASGTQGSALSYIPEVAWNESGPGAGLWSSGGGMSTLYAKPAWQGGTGIPTDGKRDVPDVSLTAAGHDGYLIYQEGALYVVGGTSAAAPSLAGIMALVGQATSARQGNANTVLYPLAIKQRAGGASVFHDIVSGDNGVPGQSGFNAAAGYDQATGLGSVDASALVSHWSDGVVVPAFHVTASVSALSVTAGSNNSLTLTASISGGFSGAISFSLSGLPGGITASFSPPTLSAPGAGSSVLKLTANGSAIPGAYSASIVATSGSTKQTIPLPITVALAPTFTFASSATSISIAAGTSKSITVMTTPTPAFAASISLAVSGLPAGITVQILPSSVVTAPGAGTTTLTFSATSKAVAKSYLVTLTATSGAITQKQTLIVNVPGFSLTPNATSVTVSSTEKGTVRFNTSPVGENSNISFNVAGLPSGVTASFSPQSVAGTGSSFSTLTLTKRPGAAIGTSHFTVTAAGATGSRSMTIALTVK